ncbi:MAG: sigma-70 family RNA polymerase sigma factor [Polyangiaceae bacterium]|nr:sigma-70 family RNA polymerase sigma factor [Polyangiaceae bacterium]
MPQTEDQQFETHTLTHVGVLLSAARRLTRNPSDAEDLVQDTLVKAFRARRQYRVGTNLKAWLLKILRNTFINRYRRDTLERSVMTLETAAPLRAGWTGNATLSGMREAESGALRPMLETEIVAALDKLPEEFRFVVLLADVEELSYREISEVIERPLGTVMSRLHRGRALLRKSLVAQARAFGLVEAETDDQSPVDLGAYRKRGART